MDFFSKIKAKDFLSDRSDGFYKTPKEGILNKAQGPITTHGSMEGIALEQVEGTIRTGYSSLKPEKPIDTPLDSRLDYGSTKDREAVSQAVLRQHEGHASGSERVPMKDMPIISSQREREKGYNNKVDYSKERIEITGNPEHPVLIPQAGTFIAGKKLRAEISDELFKQMLDFTTANDGKDSLTTLSRDILRFTDFSLRDGVNTHSIKHQDCSTDEENVKKTIQDLSEFLHDKDLCNSIGSIANQTLGNMACVLFSGICRPSFAGKLGEAATRSFVALSSEEAIGFPSPGPQKVDGSPPDLMLTLEKVRNATSEEKIDHFFLTFQSHAGSVCFFLKDRPGAEHNRILLDESLKQTCVTKTVYKITPNNSFNSREARSQDNFPCSLECLEFINEYRTYEEGKKEEGKVQGFKQLISNMFKKCLK